MKTTDSPYFEDYTVGKLLTTRRRTIREPDVAAFVGTCGFTEPLFMDRPGVIALLGGEVVPGLLTISIAEGLVMQTGLLDERGQALAKMPETLFLKPVMVGDTIWVEVEVVEITEKRKDAGFVTYDHKVFNENDVLVARYTATRLIARRDEIAL